MTDTNINQIKARLRELSRALKASTDTPQLDAELLLMHVLKKPRAFLYAHSDDVLSPDEIKQLEYFMSERLLGVPMAYLLGEREFWSLSLQVTPDTLIPRPETELLVERALSLLGHLKSCAVLELGTGTGAISIALATEKPSWQFLAVDNSKKALLVAEKNRARHDLENINLMHSDWFDGLKETTHAASFDLIISNPPYLAEDDAHQFQGDLRFEPKQALLSGMSGLDDLSIIINNSKKYLKPGGLLLLEHGYEQAAAVKHLLQSAAYHGVACWQDHAYRDRVSAGWKAV